MARCNSFWRILILAFISCPLPPSLFPLPPCPFMILSSILSFLRHTTWYMCVCILCKCANVLYLYLLSCITTLHTFCIRKYPREPWKRQLLAIIPFIMVRRHIHFIQLPNTRLNQKFHIIVIISWLYKSYNPLQSVFITIILQKSFNPSLFPGPAS